MKVHDPWKIKELGWGVLERNRGWLFACSRLKDSSNDKLDTSKLRVPRSGVVFLFSILIWGFFGSGSGARRGPAGIYNKQCSQCFIFTVSFGFYFPLNSERFSVISFSNHLLNACNDWLRRKAFKCSLSYLILSGSRISLEVFWPVRLDIHSANWRLQIFISA